MKIPKEAKRVFKGIIFDVYQWDQRMFDGTHQTFEMLKRVNTVEVIAIQGEKIYMSHQSQPTKEDFYSLFGGRGEEGEAPLVTAKRELLEEAGMTSDNWELYRVYQPVHKIDWEIYTYIARNCQRVADQRLDPGEQIEIKECTFDQFIDILLSDTYWGNELVLEILRIKDRGELDEFRKTLFPIGGKSMECL